MFDDVYIILDDLDLEDASGDATLTGSFPISATRIRYCHASLGRGRLRLYRFSAPIHDLHDHAENEFTAHMDNPNQTLTRTPNSRSPITDHDIGNFSSFGIDASWMLPPNNVVGTIYESGPGRWYHRITVFVDETNGTLYFVGTD